MRPEFLDDQDEVNLLPTLLARPAFYINGGGSTTGSTSSR
jgi:hypothetical protein